MLILLASPPRFTVNPASVTVSPMSKLSLDRILQSQGFGTRKYCRALIDDGEVSIDGTPQTNYRITFETEGLVLQIFDEEWAVREHVAIVKLIPAGLLFVPV